MANDTKHPRAFTEEFDGEQLAQFFTAPMEREYFDAWMEWLSGAFDFQASPQRRAVLFDALVEARFTNAKLGLAGDWIVSHNERFPVPAHFISCPALSKDSPF